MVVVAELEAFCGREAEQCEAGESGFQQAAFGLMGGKIHDRNPERSEGSLPFTLGRLDSRRQPLDVRSIPMSHILPFS